MTLRLEPGTDSKGQSGVCCEYYVTYVLLLQDADGSRRNISMVGRCRSINRVWGSWKHAIERCYENTYYVVMLEHSTQVLKSYFGRC